MKNTSWKGYSVADITETSLNLSEVWLDFIKDEGSIEAVIAELPTLRKYGNFGNSSLWKWITPMKGPRNNSQWSKNFRNVPSLNWPISTWPIFRSDQRFRIVCNLLLMDTRKVGSTRIRCQLWYLIYNTLLLRKFSLFQTILGFPWKFFMGRFIQRFLWC